MYPAIPAPMAARPRHAPEWPRARDAALGVTIEAAIHAGGVPTSSRSRRSSPTAFEIWLRENGYKIPKGASAALKPYINMGMKFFVAKVNLRRAKRLVTACCDRCSSPSRAKVHVADAAGHAERATEQKPQT